MYGGLVALYAYLLAHQHAPKEDKNLIHLLMKGKMKNRQPHRQNIVGFNEPVRQ
jgi:hypothetical protein